MSILSNADDKMKKLAKAGTPCHIPLPKKPIKKTNKAIMPNVRLVAKPAEFTTDVDPHAFKQGEQMMKRPECEQEQSFVLASEVPEPVKEVVEPEAPKPMEESKKVNLDGIDYDSIKDCAELTGLPLSTLKSHLESGKSWKDKANIEHYIKPV